MADGDDQSDALTISPEKAFFIIVKAREFDEQVEQSDPDSGSNPTDDRQVDVVEDEEDGNPVLQELRAALTDSTSMSASTCWR